MYIAAVGYGRNIVPPVLRARFLRRLFVRDPTALPVLPSTSVCPQLDAQGGACRWGCVDRLA